MPADSRSGSGLRESPEKVELNRKFHKSLPAPSMKARLLQAIEAQYGANSLLARYLVVRGNFVVGKPHFEHEAILGAFESRNSEKALALPRIHISQSGERLGKALENRENGAAQARSGYGERLLRPGSISIAEGRHCERESPIAADLASFRGQTAEIRTRRGNLPYQIGPIARLSPLTAH